MRQRLSKKGWSEEEINHAEDIMKKAEKNKHKHVRMIEDSLYWFVLIIGIIGSFAVSLLLIPILVSAGSTWCYLLTGIFAFLVGSLITIIIKDLHWLEKRHHIFVSLVIPIIAIVNLFIVSERVNSLNEYLGIANIHNPLTLGLIYFVGFLIPYVLFLIFRRRV